ncbi:MAG: hypothetical protein RJA76_657 [Bacteroidota bacterium]|jgi:AraC-like DNA-binding protein
MFLIRKFFIWKKKQNFDLKILHHSNNSRFNEKDLNEMEQKLIDLVKTVDQYFEENHIYLNSKLSADLLGSLLKQNPRLIGAAIRFKYGISFRDYINNRRIQYIEDNFIKNYEFHKYSLDYIGEKAGFGTRQGFYIAFKKLKNTTPKEYFDNFSNR